MAKGPIDIGEENMALNQEDMASNQESVESNQHPLASNQEPTKPPTPRQKGSRNRSSPSKGAGNTAQEL